MTRPTPATMPWHERDQWFLYRLRSPEDFMLCLVFDKVLEGDMYTMLGVQDIRERYPGTYRNIPGSQFAETWDGGADDTDTDEPVGMTMKSTICYVCLASGKKPRAEFRQWLEAHPDSHRWLEPYDAAIVASAMRSARP